jgi:hypothetical protein
MPLVSVRGGWRLATLFLAAVTLIGAERPYAAAARPGAAGLKPGATTPSAPAAAIKAASMDALAVDRWPSDEVQTIDRRVLTLALGAATCAIKSGATTDPSTLTIIDYSKASLEPRLWVLDLDTRTVAYSELVAHGQGSGGNRPTKFSNEPDSHQTSLGLFVTEGTYVGRNGYSLRLRGLDRGFNDRAGERAIVMHGAPYVNDEIGKSLGRLGRSHGCPAVRESVAREIIDHVKGGSLVFSYYPDREWLDSSAFLNGCGAASTRAAD